MDLKSQGTESGIPQINTGAQPALPQEKAVKGTPPSIAAAASGPQATLRSPKLDHIRETILEEIHHVQTGTVAESSPSMNLGGDEVSDSSKGRKTEEGKKEEKTETACTFDSGRNGCPSRCRGSSPSAAPQAFSSKGSGKGEEEEEEEEEEETISPGSLSRLILSIREVHFPFSFPSAYLPPFLHFSFLSNCLPFLLSPRFVSRLPIFHSLPPSLLPAYSPTLPPNPCFPRKSQFKSQKGALSGYSQYTANNN